MSASEFLSTFKDINTGIDILKTFFISICTYLTFCKIINTERKFNIKYIILVICIIITAVIVTTLKMQLNFLISILCLVCLLSFLFSLIEKHKIGYSILITIISLSLNYILFVLAIIIAFIPFKLLRLQNDFINLILMQIVHVTLLYNIFKMKKFKYGISFLQSQNEYIDILILNISVSILFSIIIFSNREILLSRNIFFGFIIFAIIMFVTIQKSLQLYYKQKLLIQELEETKEELENKKQEIEKLEKENLSFSKTSHSLAHKQRTLEYKINQLMLKSEIAEEANIKERIDKISKELYKDKVTTELTKTGIAEIDDVLAYMQSECTNKKIEFEVQIIGNIYHMINNIIKVHDLEILLSDHIKNAIIAIEHSKNINRSILVKLGKIENIYSLYIYDSGIEFKKETLENLGIKPSTTHKEEGGTGMGFMNTFDTLKQHEASLIIEEFGKPSKDNYTKSIAIKFDKNKKFKIKSYREKEKATNIN